MPRLAREDFFGHEKIVKLTNQIAKKSKQKINYLNVKDPETNEILLQNVDWLDYIGITVKVKDEKTITIRWEIQ